MNEINIPYTTEGAIWAIGKQQEVSLEITPELEVQRQGVWAVDYRDVAYHTLPNVEELVMHIAHTSDNSLRIIYYTNLHFNPDDTINGDLGNEIGSEVLSIHTDALVKLTPPDDAEYIKLELENFVNFSNREATNGEHVQIGTENIDNAIYNPAKTFFFDAQLIRPVTIVNEIQRQLENRLQVNKYPVYGIRFECNDFAQFAAQVKKGITISERSITGQVDTEIKYFKYTSDTKQPIVEMHFDTPIYLGQTTGLEIDLLEGEGEITLLLEPSKTEETAVEEFERKYPDFNFPEIQKKEIPARTILLGGLLLLAAITLTAE